MVFEIQSDDELLAMIRKALASAGSNQSQAARLLRLGRDSANAIQLHDTEVTNLKGEDIPLGARIVALADAGSLAPASRSPSTNVVSAVRCFDTRPM